MKTTFVKIARLLLWLVYSGTNGLIVAYARLMYKFKHSLWILIIHLDLRNRVSKPNAMSMLHLISFSNRITSRFDTPRTTGVF